MQYSSMTGFGKAQAQLENKKISVEIKSLNSKQADIFTKLPSMYKEKEIALRNIISKKLERGKIDLLISVESLQEQKHNRINKELFKSYYHELKSINAELGIEVSDDTIFLALTRIPEISLQETEQISEHEWNTLYEVVEKACENLIVFRKQEGAAIGEDIINRISLIDKKIAEIELYEGQRLETIKNRISGNLHEFFDSDKIDSNRFEQELLYYIEKLDITEEKIRLHNHCEYFIAESKTSESIGKKLSFLVQEMGREINTLGSKANHAEMQKIVIQMKDELEKIKEQIMNVL